MQETTHIKHFQFFFFLWIELCPHLALPWGPLYQQLLEKVLICTLSKIWVYQSKSHLVLPLPSSGQTQGMQSDPTAMLARRHHGYLQSIKSMARGLSGAWCCQEYACADQILSSGTASAQQQLTAERGLPLAGAKTRTWPTGPEGGGTTVGLQTQPLPLWKSHRVLKITVFSFKLIQMDTAMPLKLAKIPLIASRTIFPSAIFIMLIHFRSCIYKEFPS